MNYAEYQNIVKEYEESDSVRRREEIEEQVYDASTDLLTVLNRLYAKYGKDFVDDDEYREDRGWLSLSERNEFDAHSVYLHYSDRWSYGGECDFGIEVPMKYLDKEALSELEEQLSEGRVKSIRHSIQEKKQTIERLKKEVEELEEQLTETVK